MGSAEPNEPMPITSLIVANNSRKLSCGSNLNICYDALKSAILCNGGFVNSQMSSTVFSIIADMYLKRTTKVIGGLQILRIRNAYEEQFHPTS